MAIAINMDDTPICWDSHFKHVAEMKKLEEKRHRTLLEAGEKAKQAIEEFLNEQIK